MASKSGPGQTNTGRPPTTSVLRSALYYQNRIIVPEKKAKSQLENAEKSHGSGKSGLAPTRTTHGASQTGDTNISSATSGRSSAFARHSDTKSLVSDRDTDVLIAPENGAHATEHTQYSTDSCPARTNNALQVTPSGVPVSCVETRRNHSGNDTSRTRIASPSSKMSTPTHGIDIVVTDTEEAGSGTEDESCIKKFYKCLQDNRMKGVPNAEEILASSNPQDYKVLKKVLNISFLTIGIALLIAVVIVILYSTIGKIYFIIFTLSLKLSNYVLVLNC